MQQIISIQILRGLAAFAIVVLHAFNDASFLAAANGWSFQTPDLPLRAGVDLFFVISGFVMVVASMRFFGRPGASFQFFTRRAARIVPIYWAATTLFLLILMARPEVLNSPLPDISEIIRSYFFIPYLKASDGLIQPIYKLGWTLNYEMMFYLVFAVAIILPARLAVIAVTAFFAALVVLGLVLKPPLGALAFWTAPIILEFVAGMWVGLAWSSGFRVPRVVGGCLVLIGLALILAAGSEPSGFGRLFGWGLPAALIIAGAAFGSVAARPQNRLTRFLVGMGNASYALYLCHPFAIRLFRLIWEKAGIATAFGPTALGAWAYIIVATLAAVAISFPIYRFFENPVTQTLQAKLSVGDKA